MITKITESHVADFYEYMRERYLELLVEEDGEGPHWRNFYKAFESDLWQRYCIEKGIKRGVSNRYLITFTSNNSVGLDLWKQAVEAQLSRKIFAGGKYAYEHEETNVHCHAFVNATHTLNKSNFKMFERKYGYIDLKHVHNDNGIDDYISKEGEVREFKN